jgi:hypothetical protein
MRGYKRRPRPFISSVPPYLLSTGKPHHAPLFPPPPLSVGRAPHCLPFSSCRSWSFAEHRSCSPTRITDTFIVGELRRLCRAGEPPPRCCSPFPLRAQTRDLVVPLHRGPWTHPTRTFPPVVQPSTVSTCVVPCVLYVVAAPEQTPCVPYAPCGRRRGSSTRYIMGRARPDRALSPSGRAGRTHYAKVIKAKDQLLVAEFLVLSNS